MNKKTRFTPNEIGRQGAGAISRILVSYFYPVASQAINEFENFSREIKVNRLIEFSEKIEARYLERTGEFLSINDFKSEELHDLFELTVKKVCSTKSEYKRERFRDLLLNHIIDPLEDQIVLKFAHLLDELTDIQIIILDSISELPFHQRVDFNYSLSKYNRKEIPKDYDFKVVQILFNGQEIFLEKKEISFFVNDLISKGLIDHKNEQKHEIPNPKFNQGSSNSNIGTKVRSSFEDKYMLSKIGKDFLHLIKEQSQKPERK